MPRVETPISIRAFGALEPGELVSFAILDREINKARPAFGAVLRATDTELELATLYREDGQPVQAGYVDWLKPHYVSYGTQWLVRPIFETCDIKRPDRSYLAPGVLSIDQEGAYLCIGPKDSYSTEFLLDLAKAQIADRTFSYADHVTTDRWEVWLKSEWDRPSGKPLFVHQDGGGQQG